MNINMGSTDRLLRILFAIIVGVLYFTDQISGAVGIILGILAVIFLATSAIGYCPIYSLLKVSTRKKEKQG